MFLFPVQSVVVFPIRGARETMMALVFFTLDEKIFQCLPNVQHSTKKRGPVGKGGEGAEKRREMLNLPKRDFFLSLRRLFSSASFSRILRTTVREALFILRDEINYRRVVEIRRGAACVRRSLDIKMMKVYLYSIFKLDEGFGKIASWRWKWLECR